MTQRAESLIASYLGESEELPEPPVGTNWLNKYRTQIRELWSKLLSAGDPREVGKIKRAWDKASDAGEMPVPDGVYLWLIDARKKQLRSMNYKPRSASDARADQLLRIRDSSGRAKSRKF